MRCTSAVPRDSGWYRCVLETGDHHTEHHYNYYGAITIEDRKKYLPETICTECKNDIRLSWTDLCKKCFEASKL